MKMNFRNLLWTVCISPLFVSAQENDHGVAFVKGLTWEQIKEKARSENKYIFVDCYATWCGPCKKMDQDVYPKDSVGDYVNSRFVSVKVQLDTSKKDDETVKAWYGDAHAIMTAYKVNAFPTYLFFSPAGELVHQGLGYQPAKDFVQLAIDAADPHKQYYTLVAGYRAGVRDYSQMPALANRAKAFKDKDLSDSIAADYLHGYLDKLSNSQLCTQPNLQFIGGFARVLTSKDPVFRCLIEQPALADTAMHDKDFAKRFVNYIITKEEITPVTTKAKKEGGEPDWEMINQHIETKFGKTWVEENVVNAKIGWYKAAQDWPNYTKYLVRHMDILGLQNTPKDFWGRFGMNNAAWDVFLYSNRKEELEKALAWSDWVIQADSTPVGAYMDTKANLLYKLGKKEEAIALETRAVQVDPKNKDLGTNLEKMLHGEPTWLVGLASTNASRQKLVVDSGLYGKWHETGLGSISPDGKYLSYQAQGTADNQEVLRIQLVGTTWKKDLRGVHGGAFTRDGKMLFMQGHALFQTGLPDVQPVFLDSTTRFDLRDYDNNELLVYQRTVNGRKDELVIKGLTTGKNLSYAGVDQFWLSRDGAVLVLKMKTGGAKSEPWFEWIDLASESPKAFGYGLAISRIADIDPVHKRLIYFAEAKDSLPAKSKALPGVDIYSYKDPKLQSQQLLELTQQNPGSVAAVYDLASDKTLILARGEREVRSLGRMDIFGKDYLLVKEYASGDVHNEWNWNKDDSWSVYLLSLADGSRKLVARGKIAAGNENSFQLSPDQKYVVYYDPLQRNYFSYECSSGKLTNLTAGIKDKWTVLDDQPVSDYLPGSPITFVKNADLVVVCSQYDVYQLDLSGSRRPVCLTEHRGATTKIIFRLLLPDPYDGDIREGQPLILRAVNTRTKEEGFYRVEPGKPAGPVLLSMQACHWDNLRKAATAEVYVVRKSDANLFPNLYWSTDLRHFEPVTDDEPQQAYNWLNAELVNYTALDGKPCQGVLYKPENFDPKKKYPVLVHYYERMSDELHKFQFPEYSNGGSPDIPTYVSNGYLVFLADIHYTIGYPGRSAFNSVVGAAGYLSKYPWVDQKRMGLIGHSFGGFETDYIITHSHLFAAAAAISGMTDFVSAYGSIIGDGTSRQRQYEIYRDRIGTTLWQRPDLYIENSPVFRANQVTTPVLLMANLADGDVPHEQGFEFFTALRRLGKKSWMLQYDKGGHMVDEEDRGDFTLRLRQFFDYYLMGKTPPKWMTEGVPARLKGVENGLALDRSGARP